MSNMLYPSINEIKKKTNSRYELVILAAKRARDIVNGYPSLLDEREEDKPVSQAAYEIDAGEIKVAKEED